MEENRLEKILEALLLASDQPLSVDHLHRLLGQDLGVAKKDVRDALDALAARVASSAAELKEVAGGFRLQVRQEYSDWVGRLWQEKPPKYSRALLETLALICYRQPITRGEVEEIRGVSLSPNIVKTLVERGWIREVGVREVPGRPALFGTTQQFLDDFNLKSLDELPTLPAIKDPEQLEAALLRLGEIAPKPVAEAAPVEAAADVPAPEAAAPAEAPAESTAEATAVTVH
ncbi:MAG: SMC-Scp complex subunit ScpB [Gammaproteobacteria bacterium]|nr:SMC-Scp complex subunit ScpB [Gammaproteobacteria bacterium]